MTSEADFIALMRAFASGPAARGLDDDAAVLEIGGATLVLTTDTIVEGVHYLPRDPPADVAWKLLAVNLSDLAAKGAQPLGALLGYMLGDDEWDRAFAEGLGTALGAFGMGLLGGDTVAGGPRVLSLTAIGIAAGPVPSRSGALPGDLLWVTGSIGDAGAGLRILRGEAQGPEALVERYRNPRPRLEAGERLAPQASAMMDVSDGLFIDAIKMAEASGCAAAVELDSLPLSEALLSMSGGGREARLTAGGAGDDYELLLAAPEERAADLVSLSEELGLPISRIGAFERGSGLRLFDSEGPVPLPPRLGFEHRTNGR